MKTLLSTLILSLTVLTACNDGSKQLSESSNKELSKKETVLENIQARKSVRQFVANKPVSEEDIETLVHAGMAGPSGKNQQPWEILVIDNREILNQLAEALPNAKMLANAPMAIVMCGDTVKSSYWYLDCATGSQNILLAAEAMGLGATWTAAYPYRDRIDALKKAVSIPDHILPLNVIPVGHPEGEHTAKVKYDEKKVHRNQW